MRSAATGQIEVIMNGGRGMDVVQGQVPARKEFVGAMRSLATSVGAAHDLTVDAIEDLQIAVDEACTLVLPVATGSPLEVQFRLGEGQLTVIVSVPAANDAEIDTDSLAWTVLSAVTAELGSDVAGNCATITFTKTREF